MREIIKKTLTGMALLSYVRDLTNYFMSLIFNWCRGRHIIPSPVSFVHCSVFLLNDSLFPFWINRNPTYPEESFLFFFFFW